MDSNTLMHWGILGMKWGVRRYQNEDGTLTEAGEARYARDKRENAAKKKDNRIDLTNPDAERWVTEDTQRSKKTVDAVSDMTKELQKIERATSQKDSSSTKKMDLSSMSDKELRDSINRELLEQQYSKLFSEVDSSSVSSGRQVCRDILETTGTVLAVTSSALAIALSVRELRGK